MFHRLSQVFLVKYHLYYALGINSCPSAQLPYQPSWSHSTDGEVEAQRGEVLSISLHGWFSGIVLLYSLGFNKLCVNGCPFAKRTSFSCWPYSVLSEVLHHHFDYAQVKFKDPQPMEASLPL